MESWKTLNKILDDDRHQREGKIIRTKEIFEAISDGDKKEVKLLLEGHSVNCHYDGMTPLIACMQSDNLSLGLYLLSCRASPSYQPYPEHENALWYALKNRKYDFLEMFVLNDCNIPRAIEQPKVVVEVVEEVAPPPKKKGAPPPPVEEEVYDDTWDLKLGDTPLIYASKVGDLKLVEILLSHGKVRKKINEIDRMGRTALHHNLSKPEMTNADLEIGVLLLAAGADKGVKDFDGNTADDLALTDRSKTVLLKSQVIKTFETITPDVEPENNDNDKDNDFGMSFKI